MYVIYDLILRTTIRIESDNHLKITIFHVHNIYIFILSII